MAWLPSAMPPAWRAPFGMCPAPAARPGYPSDHAQVLGVPEVCLKATRTVVLKIPLSMWSVFSGTAATQVRVIAHPLLSPSSGGPRALHLGDRGAMWDTIRGCGSLRLLLTLMHHFPFSRQSINL